MTKEDQLFLALKPKILRYYRWKFYQRSTRHNGGIYTPDPVLSVEEDLYHDCYILLRKVMEIKNLQLGVNITEGELTGYIWKVAVTNFLRLIRTSHKNLYYECLPHSFSLDHLIDLFDDKDYVIDNYLNSHYCQLESNIDIDTILNLFIKDIDYKRRNINKAKQTTKSKGKK
jgi:hypothetical protein